MSAQSFGEIFGLSRFSGKELLGGEELAPLSSACVGSLLSLPKARLLEMYVHRPDCKPACLHVCMYVCMYVLHVSTHMYVNAQARAQQLWTACRLAPTRLQSGCCSSEGM